MSIHCQSKSIIYKAYQYVTYQISRILLSQKLIVTSDNYVFDFVDNLENIVNIRALTMSIDFQCFIISLAIVYTCNLTCDV